ncbi:MAG: hypothetical protein LBL71_00050, partial [Endomicrobium sp.]|nr:hypothetical protein [Endomicrobium sp.]
VDFYGVSAEKWISESRTVFNIIIVDPPRSGLNKHVLNFLLNSKARNIVYVSCNPSTLARDLQIIIDRHVYNVKAIVPVDMFPQTYHVEVIVLLELI